MDIDVNSESELRKAVEKLPIGKHHGGEPMYLEDVGGTEAVAFYDELLELFLAWHHQQQEAKVAEAKLRTQLEVRGDYLFMMNTHAFGRPFSYEKVLQITKDAFKETEEALAHLTDKNVGTLTNNKTTSHEQEKA